MSQAKRRTPARSSSRRTPSFQGVGTLVLGMIIGSLGTILWQGMRAADGGIGTGIRQMIEQSKKQDHNTPADKNVSEADKPVKQETNFDFFTVLPEIEVVVPTEESDSSTIDVAIGAEDSIESDVPEVETRPLDNSAYMLQAGSYKNKKDADRLKAELALKGLGSSIQKVTIQGKGDFFRVRLGPYLSYNDMASTDAKLAAQGIKTLRLKISKGG